MIARAMTIPTDERLAYASLARQAARLERQLPAESLPRLGELAPGRSSVAVELEFRIDGSGLPWVRGHVEQRIDAACQRCLERFERNFAADFDLCIVREGDDSSEIGDGADVLVAEGETVTVAEIVEDELLLALPDCLCEEEPCRFAPALSYPATDVEAADATPEATSPFSVLSKLKGADS